VAVLRTGTPPILATAGLADLDHAVPVHPATVFQTGSVTKQVTAALVLQLVDTGRVRLADPIGTHLPTLPAAWRGVTVGQLLDHTSGIPSYTDTGARWTRRWAEPLPPDSLVAMTAQDALTFAPGTRWKYNNTGYLLLGMLLERLEGAPWAAVIEARVTRPLALPSLRACDPGAVVPHRARGYEGAPAIAPGTWGPGVPASPADVVPAPYFSVAQAHAAGALCATAGDLARWSQALLAGRVVSAALRARMETPEGAARPWRYGFGLMLDSLGERRVLYHGGDIPGFAAMTMAVPDEGLAVAVMANRSHADVERLARDVTRAVLGLPVEAPPVPAALVAVDRDRLVGRYLLGMPGRPMPFALVARGEHLALQPAGGPLLPLTSYGRTPLAGGGRGRSGRDYALTFGATFDPRFRMRLEVRGGRVTGGQVLQGGGVFDVTRVGRLGRTDGAASAAPRAAAAPASGR
jgi:CubicO group peptidase (beta-lactamase class C family)